MIKLFESLFGIVFIFAAIQFALNPKESLKSVSSVLYAKNPKMVDGHLVLPKN
jgi:hypothetical protein